MSTNTKLARWCVYQAGWDEGYRDSGVGDGITRPARLLVATCDSEEEAAELRDSISAANRRNTGPLSPGSNRRVAELEYGQYEPLDFVGSQNRDEYIGKRFAALCGDLISEAAERRSALERGNA